MELAQAAQGPVVDVEGVLTRKQKKLGEEMDKRESFIDRLSEARRARVNKLTQNENADEDSPETEEKRKAALFDRLATIRAARKARARTRALDARAQQTDGQKDLLREPTVRESSDLEQTVRRVFEARIDKLKPSDQNVENKMTREVKKSLERIEERRRSPRIQAMKEKENENSSYVANILEYTHECVDEMRCAKCISEYFPELMLFNLR